MTQNVLRVRSGRGIGDSLYLRPIVDHFVEQGRAVVALSDHPAIFHGSGATVEAFTRQGSPTVAHYTETMHHQETTQYQDMLRRAGIEISVPLRFRWTVQNRRLVDALLKQAAGRPLILVHGGRVPMQRTDDFGRDLIPKRQAFEAALDALGDCYRVRIGKAPNLYPLPVDEDLGKRTTVADLLDLATICSGMVAQCSFAVPLAEVFDKPLLAVWSASGLASSTAYIRTITPKKVLTKTTSRFVVDDWMPDRIAEAARALHSV